MPAVPFCQQSQLQLLLTLPFFSFFDRAERRQHDVPFIPCVTLHLDSSHHCAPWTFVDAILVLLVCSSDNADLIICDKGYHCHLMHFSSVAVEWVRAVVTASALSAVGDA